MSTFRHTFITNTLVDIETLGQDLLEDNIVSVSRQMIDKEASVPSACRIEAVDDEADGMAVDQTA
jgi:26S proteasome regulatory subunit N11